MTVFTALADPTRLRILDMLCRREQSVTELVGKFNLTQPAVSQHLRVLRDAGLVTSRPVAQRRIYSVNPKPLQHLDSWLSRYRKFWASELDALQSHLDAHPR